MALSFSTVQETYRIFNSLKKDFLPDLRIPSWPLDMANWSESELCNPPLNQVLGWDKKFADDGWENIVFFVKDPSKELIDAFKEQSSIIPNTSICEPYTRNESIWCFGWF